MAEERTIRKAMAELIQTAPHEMLLAYIVLAASSVCAVIGITGYVAYRITELIVGAC